MKKNLLLAAALFMSVAASAQTVVWPCTATTEDKKNATAIDITPVVTGSATITGEKATVGTGIKDPSVSMTCQGTIKDTNGTAIDYPAVGTGIYKWVPNLANSVDAAYKTIDDAIAGNAYVDFKITETDETKYLEFNSATFNAWRYGTDAIRLNAKFLAVGDDGEYESDLLINAETAATFGDEYDGWKVKTDDPADNTVPGYCPSREDPNKPDCNKTNGNSSSHLTLVKPTNFPTGVYEVTLRVYIYGAADNKAAGLYNVTFHLGNDTGISNINAAEKVNANAPIYNLAGQQVTKDYKGVCIQNGKKFINK